MVRYRCWKWIIQKSMEPQAMPIKLVIVGDGVVGKTCILTTYSKNQFPTEYVPTIFDNTTTTIKVDKTIVNLSLWDTAGQEEYQRLRPLAYPNADIFLIVFSVVDPSTYLNARKKWYPELCAANTAAIKVFVGNKIDLREGQDILAGNSDAPINSETARKVFEEEMKCRYFECSALTRKGIPELFESSVREAIGVRLKEKNERSKVKSGVASEQCCQLI